MTDASTPLSMDLAQALVFSRFAAQGLAVEGTSHDAIASAIDKPFDWSAAELDIGRVIADDDAARLTTAIRRLRRRLLVHTILRDLTSRADLTEVCSAMTRLAELALSSAVELHHRALAQVHGLPTGEKGSAQCLVVTGMGKLGGGELNVSSDVDLVFLYPEDGETKVGSPGTELEFAL